jgi:hypothetical protein
MKRKGSRAWSRRGGFYAQIMRERDVRRRVVVAAALAAVGTAMLGVAGCGCCSATAKEVFARSARAVERRPLR